MATKTKLRAKYRVEFRVPGIALAIVDELATVSVTNDVQAVIADLYEKKLLMNGVRLIYRDSLGRWDEIAHHDGEWRRWRGIGTMKMYPALQFVCQGSEHEFDCTGDDWELRVFLNAEQFRAHRFRAGGSDDLWSSSFKGTVVAARDAILAGASRVLIYAVARSGRFIAIPEKKWDELVELTNR
jgi:hypothetical protein